MVLFDATVTCGVSQPEEHMVALADDRALNRRGMLKFVGASVAVGVLPACSEGSLAPVSPGLTIPETPLFDLGTEEVPECVALIRDTNRFWNDVMRDAREGNSGRSGQHIDRSAQLFRRAQVLLQKQVGKTMPLVFPDAPEDTAYAAQRVIDLTVPAIDAAALDRYLQENLASGPSIAFDAQKALSVLLSALGITAYAAEVQQLIPQRLKTRLQGALDARDYTRAAGILWEILDYLRTRDFLVLLIGIIGIMGALTIAFKIGARLLPFVGWALLVGSAIAAIIKLWNQP